ncbi:MAG: TldD/PmbA family protein [Armatimonadota bacterium]|nr:MAG: TldD/PmbA family protein [Armatimonadota bacterium]
MNDLARFAVDRAIRAGASYADCRVAKRRRESVHVKNSVVDALESSEELAAGVRVIANGGWGFAATADLERGSIERTAELAVRIAKASASVSGEQPAALDPRKPVRDSWESQFEIDPFDVPLEDKISLLLDADRTLRQHKEISVSSGNLAFYDEEKDFASSEGDDIHQRKIESGGLISATAVDGERVQERSYPSSLDGFHAAGGWEVVEGMDLKGGAEVIGPQAVSLLSAPPCPRERLPIIIDSSQMALQIHESCGHPTELDRVFGTEASYAGTSFLTPDKLGGLRYGSSLVNITADATIPGALGTFGWDDEGVPAQRTYLVKEGVFCGYLSSRETAPRVGLHSSGTMRADGANRLPLIRMTNINLEAGDWDLEEMIKDTKRGLFLQTTKSWSIDDLRLNFQFATEIAWEIKDGSLGGIIRDATYQGITPEFWGSCNAVGNEESWRMWGVTNCAKGEPVQLMHVGHGAPPTRFGGVRVGMVEK